MKNIQDHITAWFNKEVTDWEFSKFYYEKSRNEIRLLMSSSFFQTNMLWEI